LTEVVPPIIGELAKFGLLGLLLGGAIWAFWQQRGETKECWRERLTDWKAIAEVLEAFKVAIASFTKTSEARDRSSEAMARTIELQAQVLGETRREIIEARRETGEVRAVVAALKEEIQKDREQRLLSERASGRAK
jgi:hypothetical protein